MRKLKSLFSWASAILAIVIHESCHWIVGIITWVLSLWWMLKYQRVLDLPKMYLNFVSFKKWDETNAGMNGEVATSLFANWAYKYLQLVVCVAPALGFLVCAILAIASFLLQCQTAFNPIVSIPKGAAIIISCGFYQGWFLEIWKFLLPSKDDKILMKECASEIKHAWATKQSRNN